MSNNNLKLLGVYYSTEKLLNSNLATPMVTAVRPVISVQEHSYNLIIEKLLPNLVKKVNAKKLLSFIKKQFSMIETGEISSSRFIGSELTVDEIVEQIKMHDSFNVLYRTFFKELSLQDDEAFDYIHNDLSNKVRNLNTNLNSLESKALDKVFSENHARYPLTMQLDILIEVIDSLHESTTNTLGPQIADTVLSKAVTKSILETKDFSANGFL